MKNSSGGNFFSLPNEVFLLGLSPGELAVYSFLQRCENRKTHQCWPSIKTIGKAVGMSENTVRKYIRQLEERELIATEPTEVITKAKGKRNGNLLFTLRPIQEVVDEYYCPSVRERGIGCGAAACSETPAQAGKPRVTACEPPCGPITGGAEPLPLPADRGRIWAAVPPSLERVLSPSWPLYGGQHGAPGEAQRSGFAGERRSSGTSEFSPL